MNPFQGTQSESADNGPGESVAKKFLHLLIIMFQLCFWSRKEPPLNQINEYMKGCMRNALAQSTKPNFRNRRSLFVCTCDPTEDDSEFMEKNNIDQFASVTIKDKNILKKTQNRTLLLELGMAAQWSQLFKKCANFGKLKEGKMVHASFLGSKIKHYVSLQNSIINMYAKCGDMVAARRVFDEMAERDMVSYTTLITGHSQCNEFVNSLDVYLEMVRMGLKPNEFTFGSALKSAGGAENDEIGKRIHGVCVKSGYEENVFVSSALVDMYTRCGRMEEAKVVFDGLNSKNEISWNTLIAGHARKGEGHNVVNLFVEMKRGGFDPTHFTFSSIFMACAGSGALEQGKWVHTHMTKMGVNPVAFVGNTLLDMYGKAGCVEDAKKVFDRLVKKDVISWNSMLTAYARHGLGMETLHLFREMRETRFRPNEISFLSVLNSCSHSGFLDKGLYYFDMMKKDYQLEPDITHYVAVVDLLGRAGQLDRVKKFISEMTIKPTAAIWKALLGACRMHNNMELGAYAAERVFELDPHDSGPHMLLSNIYASVGRLNEAARVRRAMNESGIKKEPACSWVEIGNVIHMFVANDDTHPQREVIRKTWEKLRDEIGKIGYVPDTSHVLWYLDERERDERLDRHSEKLALAFALLNTPHGAPVRIKKNIRVCGDCHTAFKFVSMVVVDREILLRDTNRFHHFRDGSCSCRDYW